MPDTDTRSGSSSSSSGPPTEQQVAEFNAAARAIEARADKHVEGGFVELVADLRLQGFQFGWDRNQLAHISWPRSLWI